MRIGKIIEMPHKGSNVGIVADEYGTRWAVERQEIPESSSEGGDFAYRVDFQVSTSLPLLKRDEDRYDI